MESLTLSCLYFLNTYICAAVYLFQPVALPVIPIGLNLQKLSVMVHVTDQVKDFYSSVT